MKNRILTSTILLLGIAVGITGFGQYIPNGGLEDWEFDTLSTEAIGWSSSDMFYQLLEEFPEGCSLTTDAYEGQYAMRLTTRELFGDTLPTIVYCNGLTGQFYMERGFGFTQAPAGLRGYFKYDIPVGDSALIFVGLKAGNTTVHSEEFKYSGSSNSYILLDFPLGSYSGTPDSIIIGMTSGDFGTAIPGGWVQFDSLYFYGPGVTQSIPNHDLEEWKSIFTLEPEHWSTTNGFNYGFPNQLAVTRSTDSKFGVYSMKIQNKFDWTTGDTISYALTGSIIPGQSPKGGFPYQHQATSFSFWYKYSPAGNDSAGAVALFYKWNNITQQRDSLGEYFMNLPATPEWTFVDMPVSPFQIPDSALVGFTSTTIDGSYHGYNSTLWVDRVNLHAPTGFEEEQSLEKGFAYPNPASDEVRFALKGISGQSTRIQIFGLDGKLVKEWEGAFRTEMAHDLSGLKSGVYIWKIKSEGKSFYGKFAIQ